MDYWLEGELERVNRPVQNRLGRLFKRPSTPFEVYGLLSEFLSSSGKQLRPALCLLSCEAAGGTRKQALHAATAIEMFHNFTLIHDDIEDDSLLRRGKPCLHIKYGLPLALNAGDGLFMMVWREALLISGARQKEAQLCLLSTFTKVLEGQAIELGWHRSNKWGVSEVEYHRVVRGKTGALISASCEVGGILGGADRGTRRALADFGMGIGVSFQIIDDVLNIIGEEKKYRKEIGGDIKEGKRTLLSILALRMLPERKGRRLAAILHKKQKSAQDVRQAIALFKESGAVERTAAHAERMAQAAIARLDCLPDSSAKKALSAAASYVTRRQR